MKKASSWFKTACILTGLTLCSLPGSAQISAYAQHNATPGTVDGYTLPRTVIKATIVVEREVILRGPYARYAAQYLGISGAAMSDKENYRIIDASLSYAEEPDPAQTFHLNRPVEQQNLAFHWLSEAPAAQPAYRSDATFAEANIGNNNPFTDISLNSLSGQTVLQSGLADSGSFGTLPADRVSAIEKSTEQLASEAASAIFTLRKRRFDLVTGEMGENVFGAGMEAAIAEMKRIEEEYLALFIGKRYTQRLVKTYSVLPDEKSTAMLVCRFSGSKGLVAADDLSGYPIMLELTPETTAEKQPSQGAATQPVASKKGPVYIRYRVPSVQTVRLMNDTQEIARERIPVFQKGVSNAVPVLF